MHSVEVSSGPKLANTIVFWGETNRSSLLQMFFKVGVLKNFSNFIGKHHCWSIFRSRCSQVFFKVGVLKNFTIFTEKHPCQSLFEKVAGLKAYYFNKKQLLYSCFPVNIAKFLRTALFMEHLWWLLLYLFNKVAGLKTRTLLNRDSNTGVFLWNLPKF